MKFSNVKIFRELSLYIEIKMLPLSFKEYVKYTGDENDLKRYCSET